MTWCDKLAATPSAGIKLQPNYVAGDAILSAVAPMINGWVETDESPVTISRHESFAVTFASPNGFQYGVEPTRAFVDFTHRIKMRPVSAGPPVAEMLSHPLPYSQLLPEVLRRLIELASLIPSQKGRGIERIGVIANTTVNPEDAPPGVGRFIEYIGRPWNGLTEGYSFQITSTIEETADHHDRCIHVLNKEATEGGLLTIKFDWQRVFASPQPIHLDTLREMASTAEKNALRYFEDLAEGNRFDAEIISPSGRV